MSGSTQLINRERNRPAPVEDRDFGAARPSDGTRSALARPKFSEFELAYDAAEKLLFCYFTYTGRPYFTPDVLREAQEVQRLVRSQFGDPDAGDPPVRFLVHGSRTPGAWSLGVDPALLATLIRKGDRAGLRRYAHACSEIGFANATGLGFDFPIVTVALVQGDAIGGGFEAVLSSNLIVAERSTRFGLPSILFNLFPGMGGLSFLARRIPPGLAERLVMSGETYDAEQLYALGVVDVLAEDGQGVAALYDFIGANGCRHGALRALYRARRLVNPVSLEEMLRIADLWVEAACKLGESDMQKMLRFAAPRGASAAS